MDMPCFLVSHAVLSESSAHHWHPDARAAMLTSLPVEIVRAVSTHSRALSAALMWPERLALYSEAFGTVRSREATAFILDQESLGDSLADALALLFPGDTARVRQAVRHKPFDTLPVLLLGSMGLHRAQETNYEMVREFRKAQTVLWTTLDKERKSGGLHLRAGEDLNDLYGWLGDSARWMVETVAAEAEALSELPSSLTPSVTTALTRKWAKERAALTG